MAIYAVAFKKRSNKWLTRNEDSGALVAALDASQAEHLVKVHVAGVMPETVSACAFEKPCVVELDKAKVIHKA